VTFRIDALLVAGYLVEDGSIVDGRGRPSTRLRVNDHLTTILVADLGATHGRLAVGTPAGDVLVESVIESNIDRGPESALAMVTRKLDQLLKRSGRTRSSLARCRNRRSWSGQPAHRPDCSLDQQCRAGTTIPFKII
jgi:hypothetical protein